MRVFRHRGEYASTINVFDDGSHGQSHGQVEIARPTDSYEDLTKGRHSDLAMQRFYRGKTHLDFNPDGKLFDHHHEPPEVSTMSSTNIAHGSALLGMADIESRARWGQSPVPSTDLSDHSAKIVSGLKKMGVVSQGPPARRNGISRTWANTQENWARSDLEEFDTNDRWNMDGDQHVRLGSPIDISEYRRGGQRMRQVIRDSRPTNTNAGAQFIHKDQGTLL